MSVITSRHTGLSGERPHTALSDVGDPTERHAFASAFRHRTPRRCSAPRSDRCYVRSASPDSFDAIRFTPSLAKTAGRISARAFGPGPRLAWSRAVPHQRSRFLTLFQCRELGCRGVEVSQKLIRSDFMCN